MLKDANVIAFVPTKDRATARAFYGETLGLALQGEDEFALTYTAGGTTLRITEVPNFEPLPFTLVGWLVDDIAAAVQTLSGNGVAFEYFDGMPQDKYGIWSTPDGARVAWFKDPDGNMLSVTQAPAQ